MTKYRIKKEAIPFIKEKHAASIYTLDTWEDIGIDIKALEKVEPAFITYGRKTGDHSSTLGGWSREKGTDFEFTIHFPSVKFHEHDEFSKGRVTRELMNKIQNQINNFFDQFLEGNIPEVTES